MCVFGVGSVEKTVNSVQSDFMYLIDGTNLLELIRKATYLGRRVNLTAFDLDADQVPNGDLVGFLTQGEFHSLPSGRMGVNEKQSKQTDKSTKQGRTG